MFDLNEDAYPDWPSELKPRGDEDQFDVEPFSCWWERHAFRFPMLNPLVLEQWVYRHFRHTPYRLPLEGLSSREERWSTARILSDVHFGDSMDATHDLRCLSAHWGREMADTGTWHCPLLILSTPNGLVQRGEWPDRRYGLIEGHRRFRLLNALNAVGRAQAEHDVLILEYGASVTDGL